MIGTDGFQETPIVEVTRSITKHNYLVMDVDDIPRVVREAFYLAASGRPGPVLVDVPKDVQQTMSIPDWNQPMRLNVGVIYSSPVDKCRAYWACVRVLGSCLAGCLVVLGLRS